MPDEPYRVLADPDFDRLTYDEIRDFIVEVQNQITFATEHGVEKIFVTMLFHQKNRAEAALHRKNGTRPNGKEFWPELMSTQQILQGTDEQERWLVERCLPLGGCSMMVAKAKVGKSSLAVTLALSIARGIPFLNRGVTKGAVVYLFLDGPLEDIREQLVRAGLTVHDQFYIYAGSLPQEYIRWTTEMLQKTKAKLLVIDTLQKFFKFQNLNDYSEVANTMEPLLSMARDLNCHVLFLHHAGKFSLDDMDSAIGSSVLKGQGYTNFHIKRLESGVRIIKSEQRGGKVFDEVVIRFENQDGTGFMELGGTRQQAEVGAACPPILELLKERPCLTVAEIRDAIANRGMVVTFALRYLTDKGTIDTIGTKGSRKDPIRYFIAETH